MALRSAVFSMHSLLKTSKATSAFSSSVLESIWTRISPVERSSAVCMASTRSAICSVLRKLFIALVGKYFRSLFCTCSRLKVWFLFKVGEIGQDIIWESFDAGIEILCCTVKDYSFSTYAVFNGGIFSLEIGILLV